MTGTFQNFLFKGRASLYSVLFFNATCTPNFYCCRFENLSPLTGTYTSSIYCMSGTKPGFGYTYGAVPIGGAPGRGNVISDSSPYLFTLTGASNLPFVGCHLNLTSGPGGYNEWYQNLPAGRFFQWLSSVTSAFNCTGPFRNPGNPMPDINKFIPALAPRWNFTGAVPVAKVVCGDSISDGTGGSNLLGANQTDRRAALDEETWAHQFVMGLQLADSGRYAGALQVFRTVALSTSEAKQRWSAVTRIVTSAVYLPPDSGWIAPLMDHLIAVEGDYDGHLVGKRLQVCHIMNRGEYARAIDSCVILLNSGLSYTDSVLVAIDLLSLQMTHGLPEQSGLSKSTVTSVIPPSLRVTTSQQAIVREQELLMLYGAKSVNQGDGVPALPTTRQLYRNFPNPFNPTTEIRFDPLEVARVELKIYNTLG